MKQKSGTSTARSVLIVTLSKPFVRTYVNYMKLCWQRIKQTLLVVFRKYTDLCRYKIFISYESVYLISHELGKKVLKTHQLYLEIILLLPSSWLRHSQLQWKYLTFVLNR